MRFRYQTVEFGEMDIHLRTLRDTNEYEDAQGQAEAAGIPSAMWPTFGVVWGSGYVLAALMVHTEIAGRRILEVGCGIGLASMVLNARGADITATDRHPEVEGFLAHNAHLNGDPEIAFQLSNWDEQGDSLGQFDLIIASDLLYDHDQAEPLATFMDAHALPQAEVVLVDPGRGQVGAFGRYMSDKGFLPSARHAVDDAELHFGREVGARLQIHTFLRS